MTPSRSGRRSAAAVLLIALAAAACSRADSQFGVENAWRDPDFSVTEGVTTEADVLEALGPPSQIINLRNQTVFYYLKENFRSDRLLLILYNQTERRSSYDRAVFFFGPDGMLRNAAFSETELPRE